MGATNLIFTATRLGVCIFGAVDHRRIYEWVVWVRCCVSDISGVLCYGVLVICCSSTGGGVKQLGGWTYGQTIAYPHVFEVHVNAGDVAALDLCVFL